VRARSNVSGASAETCTSLPFGDALSCSGTDYSPLHYTGQPLDSESNLHHFLFRQLSTTQGRWATCDPTGLGAVDPTDPQTWNRYAYVSNSPTGFVDPLGAGVNKPYTGTFNCNTDAAGIMQQIESNFSQFGQYNGEFGPLGVPAASAAVTFGTGSATPVVQGGSIPISAVIEGPTPIPVFGYKVNVSVTVASVSPNSFTFNTDPGHVLYPASITFSASDASNGQIDFSIQVNGDFSGKLAEAGYYTGGYNLENKIWTNFINNVKAACAKSTKRKTGGSKPPAGGGGGSTPQPVAGG
jgi:RHS repeat-associated protein